MKMEIPLYDLRIKRMKFKKGESVRVLKTNDGQYEGIIVPIEVVIPDKEYSLKVSDDVYIIVREDQIEKV